MQLLFFGGWRCTLIASYRKYRFSTFSSWYSYGTTLMQTPRICYASFKFLENEAIMSYEHRLIPTFSFDCGTTSNMCIFENYFVNIQDFFELYCGISWLKMRLKMTVLKQEKTDFDIEATGSGICGGIFLLYSNFFPFVYFDNSAMPQT